jgi:hypothetical protein
MRRPGLTQVWRSTVPGTLVLLTGAGICAGYQMKR